MNFIIGDFVMTAQPKQVGIVSAIDEATGLVAVALFDDGALPLELTLFNESELLHAAIIRNGAGQVVNFVVADQL